MKRVLFVIVLYANICIGQPISQDVRWDFNYALGVVDFMLVDRMPSGHEDALAFITTGIVYDYRLENGRRVYYAYAIHDVYQSKMSRSALRDRWTLQEVLNHEQVHYNIAGFAALLLDKSYRKYNVSDEDKAKAMYDEHVKFMQNYNKFFHYYIDKYPGSTVEFNTDLRQMIIKNYNNLDLVY